MTCVFSLKGTEMSGDMFVVVFFLLLGVVSN